MLKLNKIWLLVAVCALTLTSSARVRAAKPARPSFVVILCDDLGYGDLGCFGHPTIKTPNLDKFAESGARLTDCYSAAPVCSPSRAGLITGRTPSRLGVYDWISPGNVVHLKKDEVTIASLLKKAGYQTCHVGKWHLNGKFNSPEQPQPGDHGFDHWFATQNNASPTHHNPKNFVRNGKPVGPLEGYSCQLVADEAIRWLKDEHKQDQPFFLFVCFHEPHEPIASPDDLVARYPKATKKGEALYYANVTNMDRAAGRLIDTLNDLKLADDTVVFFTSDNGPETLNRYRNAWRSHGSPGPLRGMKLHMYDGGIRVPGILRWPGVTKPGEVVKKPICSLDLLPTFCAAAGVKPPADRKLDGTNILPLLEGKQEKRDKPLFWHYYRAIGAPKAAMRDGDWMILGHWDGPRLGPGGSIHKGDSAIIRKAKLTDFELYNLRDDLKQAKNVADAQSDLLKKLGAKLKAKYADMLKEAPDWDKKK